MKRLIQPNKDTCGQTCVAMAAGISVKEAIDLFGFSGRTNARQLAQMLQACGFTVNLKAKRIPKHAICRISYRNGKGGWRKKGHWVLMVGGKVFDPLGPEITSVIGIGGRATAARRS